MPKPAILALVRQILTVAGTAPVAKGDVQTSNGEPRDRCSADHRVFALYIALSLVGAFTAGLLFQLWSAL